MLVKYLFAPKYISSWVFLCKLLFHLVIWLKASLRGFQDPGLLFFSIDYILSCSPEHCTKQSCMKEKTLVLISVMSGLFVHLLVSLMSACKIKWQTCCRSCWFFPEKWQTKYFWLNTSPHPPVFLRFLARRFSDFQTYTKDALGRKLFPIKCRQAENANFLRGFFNEGLQFSVKGIFIFFPTT